MFLCTVKLITFDYSHPTCEVTGKYMNCDFQTFWDMKHALWPKINWARVKLPATFIADANNPKSCTFASSTYGVNSLGRGLERLRFPDIQRLCCDVWSSPGSICDGGVGMSPRLTALASASWLRGMMWSKRTSGRRSLMISRSSRLSRSRLLMPLRLTLCWVLLTKFGSGKIKIHFKMNKGFSRFRAQFHIAA